MKKKIQSVLFSALLWNIFLPNAAFANWEKVVDGRLPVKALRASTTFNGEAMYIARAVVDGSIHIGKTVEGWRYALIPYGDQERWVDQYEVYTGLGVWVPEADGRIPEDAIKGGNEADGRPLYIVRAVVGNELTVGKIQPGGSALIPWGGKENYVNRYEILCKRVVVSSPGGMEGLYAFRLFNGKALEFDLRDGNTNGAKVGVWDYWGGENQQWRVQSLNNGYYKITSLANGKALSAWNEDVGKNGCRITLWDYWGGDSQQWDVSMFSSDKLVLRCKASINGKVLDIDKNKTGDNGSSAQLYDYWQGLNQFWMFEKIDKNMPPDPTDVSPPRIFCYY
jgi:Protein of unknown function (DUF3421)/Ricin-type beta-trefoil lectin domain-like